MAVALLSTAVVRAEETPRPAVAVTNDTTQAPRAPWRPQLNLALGGGLNATTRELDAMKGETGDAAGPQLGVQLGFDVLHGHGVAGAFVDLGIERMSSFVFTGLRGGYAPGDTRFKLLGEAGVHVFRDLGGAILTTSHVPGDALPFLGARVEWAPRLHRFFSPSVALSVRQDLTTSETAGMVQHLLGEEGLHRYRLGGTAVALQLGAVFDFQSLVE